MALVGGKIQIRTIYHLQILDRQTAVLFFLCLSAFLWKIW